MTLHPIDENMARNRRRLEETFSYTENEDAARGQFEQLAADTVDFLKSVNAPFYDCFDVLPQRARHFLWMIDRDDCNFEISSQLRQRWEAWDKEFAALQSRNPQLELREVMHLIGETHDCSSWPNNREWPIYDWIKASNPNLPPPFDDARRIVTAEFYQRLCELQNRCGGWLYWSNAQKRIAFVPEAECESVRAAQDAEFRDLFGGLYQTFVKMPDKGPRLETIVAMARGNSAFWNLLKTWEIDGKFKSLVGPVDPMFKPYLDRIRQPNDGLTDPIIMIALRQAMRRDLELSDLFPV